MNEKYFALLSLLMLLTLNYDPMAKAAVLEKRGAPVAVALERESIGGYETCERDADQCFAACNDGDNRACWWVCRELLAECVERVDQSRRVEIANCTSAEQKFALFRDKVYFRNGVIIFTDLKTNVPRTVPVSISYSQIGQTRVLTVEPSSISSTTQRLVLAAETDTPFPLYWANIGWECQIRNASPEN
jgi:hypothetical protein